MGEEEAPRRSLHFLELMSSPQPPREPTGPLTPGSSRAQHSLAGMRRGGAGGGSSGGSRILGGGRGEGDRKGRRELAMTAHPQLLLPPFLSGPPRPLPRFSFLACPSLACGEALQEAAAHSSNIST